MKTTTIAIALALAASAAAAGPRRIYTLYWTSPTVQNGRVHLATFDAFSKGEQTFAGADSEDYNRTTCSMIATTLNSQENDRRAFAARVAADPRQDPATRASAAEMQQGSIQYWCEPGPYRFRP